MKTSELKGAALDWAVAKCEGFTDLRKNPHRFTEEWDWIMTPPRVAYGPVWLHDYEFSTSWKDGGPIIEREGISIRPDSYTEHKIKAFDSIPLTWKATRYWVSPEGNGPTPLEAAMRCYVASKLGDEVEIPEELI